MRALLGLRLFNKEKGVPDDVFSVPTLYKKIAFRLEDLEETGKRTDMSEILHLRSVFFSSERKCNIIFYYAVGLYQGKAQLIYAVNIGVARTLKKLRTSKGDYWIKQ